MGLGGGGGMVRGGGGAQTSPAPAAAPAESPYAITYIEVEPAQAGSSRSLLARYRDSLKDEAALEFSVFEQIGRPNHFAIVEQGPTAKARQDTAASAASHKLRAALVPPLSARYDARPQYALATRPPPPGTTATAPAA